jgi:hypothetical protein
MIEWQNKSSTMILSAQNNIGNMQRYNRKARKENATPGADKKIPLL